MGRSPGGLIAAQSHIKMNKLLLALAIGLGLLALVAGSSEEENRVESFESGLNREAGEADPARRQRKDQAKRKNQTERKNQAQEEPSQEEEQSREEKPGQEEEPGTEEEPSQKEQGREGEP